MQEKFNCSKCKEFYEIVGLKQLEERYYKVFVDTDQIQDFHGDGTVLEQKYFCLKCNEVFG